MPRLVASILTLVICLSVLPFPAHAASTGLDTLPANATPSEAERILAQMSDEQVRRLLLEEVKRDAAQTATTQPDGLDAIVRNFQTLSSLTRDRFDMLFSGAASAPTELPGTLRAMLSGVGALTPGQLAAGLAALTILWAGFMRLFRNRTRRLRRRIEQTAEDAPWRKRAGRLLLRAAIDLFGLLIGSAVVLTGYLAFFGDAAGSRPVLLAWLLAIILLETAKLAGRFLLAPKAPGLRILPLPDHAALLLQRWWTNLNRVAALGLFTCTLIRMEQGSEALFLLAAACFGFAIAAMLCLLALWHRNPVANAIRSATRPGTLPHQFADVWHAMVVAYVLFFWLFWVFALIVFGGRAMLPGVMTLLFIPLCLLLDWGTQRLVTFAANLAGPGVPLDREDSAETETPAPSLFEPTRFQSFLSSGFRLIILTGAFFGLLAAWGMDIEIGRATVRAAFSCLITLVLAYILWVTASRCIERRLRDKSADQDPGGSHEGGGPGGDRFSTLLQLLRKFIFAAILVVTVLIILSSLGVDIGPLIAGASVFGIALGFGAQTLVKDVISGIFFLMDDAFRVGDYIETGGAMGTVEEISVRSIKLRHHLGMLYTIPFGSMNLIRNNTRDWAVMKLNFLVPFDTDIQKVKKIVKTINREIRAIPELDALMLDDIKSQGVKAMEEHGMRMRVKFMTRPGGQFTLRKLVLAKLRKHFREQGIEFARPRVAVQIPENAELTPEQAASVSAAASKAVEKPASEKDGTDR